ncbi:MAG: HAD family hydrolase [Atopobiaceae bacterium]|jgi:FMN phosphatase YigB (HAD superfamily)|nr:HAD family hydrolase [Atopobiaceae bacterium]MCH4180981.1 HAD family hydrolase [Atopobiaceae bacterium]MCH4214416.1 HAD family hydrolase [Atopobiaceae bacterium]MCH4229346.1 HAD family hydrolase [Atopobiaceae bacterium]MCH4276696.1 HAD family hydrolase [Atopobiaceae bacterium]
MIKAVLFDMDDTLLSINLTAFVAVHAAKLTSMLSRISRTSAAPLGIAYTRAYLAISAEGRTDSLTNDELFCQTFQRLTHIPLDDPAIADALDTFERTVTPRLSGGPVQARPRPGARKAVTSALDLGLDVALATNPSFSASCVRTRMEWADVADIDFVRVSSMENSTRVKPFARYYQEFAGAMGLTCDECLMVGNDASRDFPRPDCGLATAYVGHGWPKRAVWRGDPERLARDLPFLVDDLNRRADA